MPARQAGGASQAAAFPAADLPDTVTPAGATPPVSVPPRATLARTTTSDAPRVGPGSHLTLHYRVSLTDSGDEVVSTFGSRPATVQLGLGQLAEPLERCLLGLAEGDRRAFELAPGEAFGQRNPDMIQRVARALLEADETEGGYRPGDLVGFPSPDGGRIAGVLKALDERAALIDFNHPLAGRAVRLEVDIVGVL